MNYRAHLISGFILVVIFLALNYFFHFIDIAIDLNIIIISCALIMFYSLLPDIDIGNSKITAFTSLFILGIILLALLLTVIPLAIFFVIVLILIWIIPLFGHRNHTHSISAAVLLTLPILFIINLQAFVISFIAYMSHLLADMEIKLW